MKFPEILAAFAVCSLLLFSHPAAAAPINLAAVSCQKYQNEIVGPNAPNGQDPINLVMWLFGYSVAKSGAHVMYGDALSSFGFALDAECKNAPNEVLLDALGKIKIDEKNPMDLTGLDCGTFLERHVDMEKKDREGADTIMMWLFGFTVGKNNGHVVLTDDLKNFEAKFQSECQKQRGRSLYDTVSDIKM
ncbi:MAG TPA: HdeA/HdeB family chaperone [Steroidobacteraceae bacterium]|jgi:hypothetical protein